MCEPMTLAIGGMVVGSAVQAYGQYQEGQYRKAVAEQNAQVQDQAADLAIKRGEVEVGRIKTKAGLEIGRARTEIARSGLDIGSATDVLEDARMYSELDALTARNNARREAWGYKVQGVSARAQGQLDEMRGTYGAVGSLLTGAGSAARTWREFTR